MSARLGHVLALLIGLPLTCAIAASTALAQQGPDDTVERETRFAFLPHIFVDLERGSEVNRMARGAGRIGRCDNDELNCLTGRTFHVVWPRDCSIYSVGESWALSRSDGSEIRSTVIGSFSRHIRHGLVELHIIQTEGRANHLYILAEGSGLFGVIHDPLRRGDLAERIEDPAFLELLGSGLTRTDDTIAISYLAGAVQVGDCAET